jgi:SlyX protein
MNEEDLQRMARVEERLAWLERHVSEQDKVMLELSETLDRLRGEAEILRQRVSDGTSLPPPEDERPPHY